MWILPLIIFILIIIIGLVTGVILFVTRVRGKQIDVLPNMPFVMIDNSRIKFTEGYFLGLLKSLIPRMNDTYFLEFYPIDIIQGENVPRPEIQSLIIAKEFLKPLSLGDKSTRRQVLVTIARSKSDLPEKMRNTLEGNFETMEGQKAFLEQTFGKVIPAGDEAISELLIQFSRGNLNKLFINQLLDIVKAKNNMTETTPENKPKLDEKRL